MTTQEKINRILSGDIDMILSCVSAKPDILRLNAIMYGARQGIQDKQFLEAVSKATHEHDIKFFGTPLSAFAKAALEILSGETFTDDVPTVNHCREAIQNL